MNFYFVIMAIGAVVILLNRMNKGFTNGFTEEETCDRLIEMQHASQEDPFADVEPVQEPWEVEHGEDS